MDSIRKKHKLESLGTDFTVVQSFAGLLTVAHTFMYEGSHNAHRFRTGKEPGVGNLA